MNIGIDSYCYHRLFGEVYPEQEAPKEVLSFDDFMNRAEKLDIDGVSLESCFIPQFDQAYLEGIKNRLDKAGLDRVYAWGHPDGLEGGANEAAYDDMIQHIEYAKAIGAKVMRVVGSSAPFTSKFGPKDQQIKKLIKMFTSAADIAAQSNIKLAVENHIDYNSGEILEIIKGVNRPNMGVNFDSGNFLRLLDDPVEAMEKLAPYVFATHLKDMRIAKGIAVNSWRFFSCVPTGEGVIDNEKIAKILKEHAYQGFLAVEVDFLHPDYANQEEEVVRKSVKELRRIADSLK